MSGVSIGIDYLNRHSRKKQFFDSCVEKTKEIEKGKKKRFGERLYNLVFPLTTLTTSR
jgi:hypothetical protein